MNDVRSTTLFKAVINNVRARCAFYACIIAYKLTDRRCQPNLLCSGSNLRGSSIRLPPYKTPPLPVLTCSIYLQFVILVTDVYAAIYKNVYINIHYTNLLYKNNNIIQ